MNWNPLNPVSDNSSAPYQIFNIGNSNPVELNRYISVLENTLGKKAIYNYMDLQPGDVPMTHADTTSLESYINFKPQTSIDEGIGKFVEWYKAYYNTTI
jgi:UDP-glucuronate 4-epimerase